MDASIRQHTGAGLVAAGIVAAALAQGLFEPMAYAGASIVIWAAVIAGLVGRGLPTTPIGRIGAVAGICLAVTAVLALASVGWASDQGRAFEEAVRVSFYLSLFTLALCTASDNGRSEWISGLTAGLAVVSIIGLFSYLQPGILDNGDQSGGVPNAAGRLAYPIGYWNGFAELVAVATILLAYAGVRAPTRSLRTISISILPLTLLGVWLTDSRAGAAATVIGLAVLVAASPRRSRQLMVVVIGAVGGAVLILTADQMSALTSGVNDAPRRADGDWMSALALAVVLLTGVIALALDGRGPRVRISRPVGIGLAVLAGLGICAAIAIANPVKQFREFKAPPSAAAPGPTSSGLRSNGRWQFWGEAVDAFESAPIAGVGAGGYEDWWALHAPVPLFVRNPHSLPLQQGAELGVLGLALFIGFVGATALAVVRRLRTGLGADVGVLTAVVVAGGFGAAIDWSWELPAAFGPAVIAAGLLVATAPSRPLARNGYLLGVGTLAAGWLAMVAGGLVVLSELELQQSRDSAAADQLSQGASQARAAHTVQPWSAEPYIQLALLDEQHGDPDQALISLRQAEARDSQDWRLPLIEARLQAERGNSPAARTATERARDLSPQSPLFSGYQPSQG